MMAAVQAQHSQKPMPGLPGPGPSPTATPSGKSTFEVQQRSCGKRDCNDYCTFNGYEEGICRQ
ncbi:hypothetical protein BGX23_002955, partial [Mortierella sp. AD031]